MKNGNIDFDADPRLITESDLATWTRKTKPQTNDVILSRRCNPGETAFVGARTEFALGQNLVILRAAGEREFPPYLRWVVRSHQWWAEVSKYLNPGAVFDSLKCADIPKFMVPFPPLPEQKAIAHILGSLDDKIELNRRMNTTLEGMAQALFKSWFVDFDPVIDNAHAAGNPIPDELKSKAELRRQNAECEASQNHNSSLTTHHSLFPAAFQFTEELGWIPEGWKVEEIRDRTESIQYGLTQSATEEKCGPKFLRITDIRGGAIDWGNVPYCEIPPEQYEKYQINEGDIFVARTGASTGENVYVTNPEESVFASYLVRFKFEERSIGRLVGMFMRTPAYFDHIEGILGGSAQPNASAQALASATMVFPEPDVANLFFSKVSAMDDRRASSDRETQTLTKLRDTLLPKLISGELKTNQAVYLQKDLP